MPFSTVEERNQYQKDRREKLHQSGRCTLCGAHPHVVGKRMCQSCRDTARDALHELKQLVIDAYGGGCACCGETTYEFLSIDHKYNDGAEERRRLKTKARCGLALLRLIVREDFPERYQILCYNCNMSKGFFGECPHRKRETCQTTGPR